MRKQSANLLRLAMGALAGALVSDFLLRQVMIERARQTGKPVKILLAERFIGPCLVLLLCLSQSGLLAKRDGSAPACGDQKIAARFITGCSQKCQLNGADPQCSSFCHCAWDAFCAGASIDSAESQLRSAAAGNQATLASLQPIVALCGGDLADHRFLTKCEQSCSAGSAACTTECSCVLAELRHGHDRKQSTQWLLKMTQEPVPSAETEERLAQSRAACQQSAPP